jgi:hypothetical protein
MQLPIKRTIERVPGGMMILGNLDREMREFLVRARCR